MKSLTFDRTKIMVRYAILAILLVLPVQSVFAGEQFPSRKAAVKALAEAVANRDETRLEKMFGSEYQDFQKGQDSDPALVDFRSDRFVSALKEFHSFVSLDDERQILIVGAMAWPFPIPLVHSGDQWYFDGAAGVEELRNRIVGANELNAIALLDVYAEAQRQYSLVDNDGDGVLEFAARLISKPGAKDGLYWEYDEGDMEPPSPLDLLKKLADATVGDRPEGSPFLGYYFRILYSQGEHAKAGAYDYSINGHLLGGFAMLAWPAHYGETGVMSFMVNQDHIIYQSDLGDSTAEQVEKIISFDPGEGWSPVNND